MRKLRDEQGSTLVVAALAIAVLAFTVTGRQLLAISEQKSQIQLNSGVQAHDIAKAGLIETVNWFRRQPVQPVRDFQPTVENLDTIDPAGIIREYGFGRGSGESGGVCSVNTLCARYEILKSSITANGDVQDITDARIPGHNAGEGLVWSLRSTGLIYKQKDSSRRYDQFPNELVARTRLTMEIRRLSLMVPIDGAAATVLSQDTVSLQNKSRLIGSAGAGGLVYFSGTALSYDGTSSIDPAPLAATASTSVMNPISVFGATDADLRAMADMVVGDPASLTLYPQTPGLVYINGNAIFNRDVPLCGTGVLFVNGDLTVEALSNSVFSGVIYVTGNVNLHGPFHLSGAVLTRGSLQMNGDGDVAEIQYDPVAATLAMQQLSRYRETRPVTYAANTKP